MKLVRACFILVSVWGVIGCDSPVQPKVQPPPAGQPALAGQIAFVSSGLDSVQHIYVLDVADSTVTQLTSATVPDYAPAWSPDRRSIAFHRGGDTATAGVWVMAADGSGAFRIAPFGGSPTWSSDGRKIAVIEPPNSMIIMNTDGSGAVWIHVSPGRPVQGGWWHARDAAWSPDGSTIAFNGQTLDAVGDPFLQIYLMDANGVNVRRLTSDNTYLPFGFVSEVGPSWSPDGKRVAFWSELFGITVANRDGSGLFSVTKDDYASTGQPPADGFGTTPDWSPDGQWLVFARGGQLVVTRADGTGEVRPVTSLPARAYSPAWSR